jgi:hypothetical protein
MSVLRLLIRSALSDFLGWRGRIIALALLRNVRSDAGTTSEQRPMLSPKPIAHLFPVEVAEKRLTPVYRRT